MNLDPMAMQSMFLNGGFGAGVNMGMGIGGFDGGVGAGFDNSWNGQQSWNLGPINFNPNASSMGSGDYGANNSGYAPHAASYNQGNYGRQNQYNDYQTNYGSQGFRGRGRGRGGYSRGGGYGHGGSNDAFSQQFPQQFGSTQQPNGPTSDSGLLPTAPKAEANVDEFGREIRQKSESKEGTPSKNKKNGDATQEPNTKNSENSLQAGVTSEAVTNSTTPMDNGDVAMPIQTLDNIEATPFAQGYNVNAYSLGRGGYGQGPYAGGRGGFSSVQAPYVKPVDVPINAPTGPKAMREGLPNTSLANLRGRGYPIPGARPETSASASVVPEPLPEKDLKERNGTRSPSRDIDRPRDRSRSKSKERKRSRSRDKHRRHRHRSNSPTEDDQETERRRERRREQRRRREEEEGARDDELNGEKVDEERVDDVPEERSRSASPSDSKRSSHRSRRDKDKYRERERDSDRDYKSSSHRRHSHRSRSRDRDRDREKERERDRDREHRHRSSHSRRHSPDEAERSSRNKVDETPYDAPTEAELVTHQPSSNGINGIEIKGASIRRKSTVDDIKIPTGPRQDRIPSSASTRDRDKSSRGHGHHRDDSHRSSHHESSRSSARDKDRHREEKENIKSAPAPPVKDPHELEREARNRERLLKEAQRIAGLTAGFSGRKRSRDEGDEGVSVLGGGGGGGVKSRRKKGRRGGAVLDDENEEARIARLEAEREGSRWG